MKERYQTILEDVPDIKILRQQVNLEVFTLSQQNPAYFFDKNVSYELNVKTLQNRVFASISALDAHICSIESEKGKRSMVVEYRGEGCKYIKIRCVHSRCVF